MKTVTPTLINPGQLYDPTLNGYSHIAVVPQGLTLAWISGQYASGSSSSVTANDFAGQLAQSFKNLRIAIEALGGRPESVVKLTVLVVDHSEDKLPLLGAELNSLFGEHCPAITLIPVPRLALDSMLFEIEAGVVIATQPVE